MAEKLCEMAGNGGGGGNTAGVHLINAPVGCEQGANINLLDDITKFNHVVFICAFNEGNSQYAHFMNSYVDKSAISYSYDKRSSGDNKGSIDVGGFLTLSNYIFLNIKVMNTTQINVLYKYVAGWPSSDCILFDVIGYY